MALPVNAAFKSTTKFDIQMNKARDVTDTGVVIIGRNEGERLRNCLQSLRAIDCPMIYVDSGSTDGSVALARSFGCLALELDVSLPLSAARARNAGLAALQRNHPGIKYVQFIDGDCTIDRNWMEAAYNHIKVRDDLAIVCGHLRERFAQLNIYTQLCDLEWRGEVGEIDACGGIFFANIDAIQALGMFNEAMIAGEEPELCYRLKLAGWKIDRIDSSMAHHESDINKTSQLFRRARRCGHSYAQSYHIHRSSPGAFKSRNLLSVIFWGAMLPISILLLITINLIAALALASLYILLWIKIYIFTINKNKVSNKVACIFGLYTVAGKFSQFFGVLDFYSHLIRRQNFKLIEYK